MKEVSEDIDINKASPSTECIICHYWYFLVPRFQQVVCNRCHDVLMMPIDLNSIFILNIHGVDYHCIITGITKLEAINLLINANLSEKEP